MTESLPPASGTLAPPSRELPWTEIRPRDGWWPELRLGEYWAYRELAITLASRTFLARYKQAAFGIAWAVVQPLVAVGLFTFVFGHIAGLDSEGLPYPLFVLVGIGAWTYVSSSVSAGARIFVDNPQYITKIYFPRLLGPLSAVFPPLLAFGITLLMIAAAAVFYGTNPGPAVLTAPLWFAALILLAFAVGAWLASLNIKYRDVGHALDYALQLWFYSSPVVFSAAGLTGVAQYVLYLNPMAGILEGLRWSLVGGTAPGPEVLVSLASLVLLLIGGLIYFRRTERLFADLI